MRIAKKLMLMMVLIAGALHLNAQPSDAMAQKMVFRKTTITIGEILKELIHTKKINLSYSPNALNLDEVINLPSKEIMIGDLLKAISNKTGNKLIVKGRQVIIKKDRNVLPQQMAQTEHASNKEAAKDTSVLREISMAALVPRTSLIERNDSSWAKPVSIAKALLVKQTTPLKVDEIQKIEPPARKANEFKNSLAKKKINNGVMFGAGGGIGPVFLSNLADSGQNFKTKAAFGWVLQTNILWKPSEKWMFETGVGLNRSNYSVESHFNKFAIEDSLSYDTISSQNIHLKINSLEIPVMVNYSFKMKTNNIIAGIGGSIQYAINGKREYANSLRTVSKNIIWDSPSGKVSLLNSILYMNRINYCFRAQLGYQHERWTILAGTRVGLNSFTKTESGRLLQFTLSYTYRFFQ